MARLRFSAFVLLVELGAAIGVSAQSLPSEPLTAAGGRLIVGGQISASFSSNPDDPGWFNYTEYERNTLRLIRLGLTAEVRATDRFQVLADLRTENGETPEPYALYLRVRPWPARELDVQIGRIPPTFGAFSRRSYETDNPLIGYPLAYQYLTTIRSDALPASPEDLAGRRGPEATLDRLLLPMAFPDFARCAGFALPVPARLSFDAFYTEEGRVACQEALVHLGNVAEGLAVLDEVMVSAAAGELSPVVTGLVYCAVIACCHQVFAIDRAREWTGALAAWCDAQPQLVSFTIACLVHRAEIMQLRGAWPEAMAEGSGKTRPRWPCWSCRR